MIIFLSSHLNHMLRHSSEPSHRNGSDEGSQHMFYTELTKIIHTYHQIFQVLSSALPPYSVSLHMTTY